MAVMADQRDHGLLNPGEMGAAVGRCLTSRGLTVLWASARPKPRKPPLRAKAAGLTDAGSVRQLTADADVIFSVCPPHAALDVAWAVHGFTGLYVDANAVSPGTAREVAQLITSNGGQYVDGGIIGPPPAAPGTTRLYLSGEQADKIKNLFAGTGLDPLIAAGPATAASAVKMAYASWTKGTAALLLAARALAASEGVEDVLLAEWALSQPQLADQSGRAALSAVTKGWRWVGEMEEIAQTMGADGLPDGFHQAAAEIYRRCPRLPGSDSDDDVLSRVIAAISG